VQAEITWRAISPVVDGRIIVDSDQPSQVFLAQEMLTWTPVFKDFVLLCSSTAPLVRVADGNPWPNRIMYTILFIRRRQEKTGRWGRISGAPLAGKKQFEPAIFSQIRSIDRINLDV